jgi:hypothetical protein
LLSFRATPWPYKQPEKPNWGSMRGPLRRAAIQYTDQKYEAALCTILKAEGDAKYYGRSVWNLQLPPLAPVQCGSGR